MKNTPENNKDSDNSTNRPDRRQSRGIRLPSDHPIYSQGWTVGPAPVFRTAPPSTPGKTDENPGEKEH